MTDYYDDLDNPAAERWVRVGWRQRLEQVYRFEVALECVRATDGLVVDVGCGLADLARYAAACGERRQWLGIEPRASFAAEAAREHTVLNRRYHDVENVAAACAVAVGTLAGSTDISLRGLAEFMSASADAFCIIALDGARLRDRPALAAEHRSTAVERHELEAVAIASERHSRVVEISTTDLALFVWRGQTPAIRSRGERFDATVAGPWGADQPAEQKAWLACELGLAERAARWISVADPNAPLAAVVVERLQLQI